MKRQFFFAIALLMVILLSLPAQDFGFGFGDETEIAAGIGGSPAVSISGEASASLLAYVNDFSDGLDHMNLGDIFSGKLNFSAGTSFADGVINLKLQPSEQPISIDEAYIRAYFGGLEVEGGLRKLTWGKADSFGPLDVINPLDYSELTDLSSMMNFKIARPLVHLTYRIGSFSKIEGVFVPAFEPLRFAEEGRWVPAQMKELEPLLAMDQNFDFAVNRPDTATLNYAQAGLRFTTTIGPADIGFQYYYGRLTRPAFSITYNDMTIPYVGSMSVPSAVDFVYNPYHQIGIDWAQVLFGFNIRAEFAANITEDLDGDDVSVYNPQLAWSFGFDRDLFLGINLNIQCNETIRLMNDKITDKTLLGMIPKTVVDMIGIPDRPLDIEADTDMTSTQIIAALSKSFLKGELELRVAAFWEIEAKDFMLIPSLVWTKDAVSVELSGGIFGGDKGGQFGQYHDNSFVKAVVKYRF
ncbi:MAG: hypothetical protein LBH97_01965 [Treponema sp.]|jgi:hypothetical protein|nr:hypothetical protein [Treponema sp.]